MARQRVLITGGSRGIGREIARHFASAGWAVIVAARHYSTVDQAVQSLEGDGHTGIALNVAEEQSWDEAMNEIDETGGIDGLVAAAGVIGPIGPVRTWRPAELKETLAINLLGTALALFHAIPRLSRRGGAAVTFSGGGGTAPHPHYDAYAASKAGVVRLTENVAASGARVNCVAPGFIRTEIHQATLAAGPQRVGPEYFELTRRQLEEGGADVAAVCELVAFLLSDEAGDIRGKLIAAQWDPWRDPNFRRRLADEPDLATLRRIDDQAFKTAH
jgi:NAD(P)-dependent dehydrogenase (short-subunit alcohol dehydrogenase family)